VGYSQGACVMHAAADDLPEELYPKIDSIVMFGDPMVKLGSRGDFPDGLRDKVLQNCASGDPVSLTPA
ncbi:cutinase family protein, partial [Candidatus Bathyarchaeota archaeon]|nr:cutinase family protein [Candidatus Bathyarchaeota archaeon]